MNKQKIQQTNLTEGPIFSALLLFALPMILGNMLQQIYNIVDTLIVGRCIGANALAAVGSAYTLLVFLTSVIIGLCMGSGALFSFDYGGGRLKEMKTSIWQSFLFIGSVTWVICILVFPGCDGLLWFLRVPMEVKPLMREYCLVIFCGLPAVFLYNFFSYVLRSMGNSRTPLLFLGISSIINIFLDLLFVPVMGFGVAGAAGATVISQTIAGVGLTVYTLWKGADLRPKRRDLIPNKGKIRAIAVNDAFTCMQQSAMNFGILLIQGLVNSFGPVIMAAFAAAVKIDTLAYMPAQEYGNAYSLFISQNTGAKKPDRIRRGTRDSVLIASVFSLMVSLMVCIFAGNLMGLFVNGEETQIILEGVRYLRIEGACYIGIGCLFLLYGYFRGNGRPHISLLLTGVSLGTRVVLAYLLAPHPVFGVTAIWAAIPSGWALADLVGFMIMLKGKSKI